MANTLAYYIMATISAVKRIIVQTPGVDYAKDKFYKTFTTVFYEWSNKLEFSVISNVLWVRSGAYPCVEHLKGASLG